MKINLNKVRSKSQHKKPVAADIYFPAMDYNHNANFIIKKSLKLNNINKEEENKLMKLQDLKLFADNNPQSANVSYLTRKVVQKTTPLITSNKKMSYQLDLSTSREKQSPWKNKSAIYITKRQMSLFEQKYFEIEQKKRILNGKMLTRKQSFQSFKRMKKSLREKQKQDFLSDLLFKKLQHKRQQQLLQIRKLLEKSLIHEENLEKISMQRQLKLQKKQEQLSLVRSKLIETQIHSEYLKFQKLKAKKNHQSLLKTKLEFLKNGRVGQREKVGLLTERLSEKTMHGNNDRLNHDYEEN